MKLLVNAPTGEQQLIEVGEGGGYFDASRVVWDERTDGPLPAITLGGMVRSGGALQFNQARMDEHTAVVNPPLNRQAAAAEIDDTVAAVYGRFTRFQVEYEAREAQAQAFKDGGYTGAVPARIAEFATPAGLTGTQAADLILSQAAALRTAMGTLSALRMRKYEVLAAATDADARTALAAVLAGIATVAHNLA